MNKPLYRDSCHAHNNTASLLSEKIYMVLQLQEQQHL